MIVDTYAFENFVEDLKQYYVHAYIDNIDEVCVELFLKLIYAMADVKGFIDTGQNNILVDSSGARIVKVTVDYVFGLYL